MLVLSSIINKNVTIYAYNGWRFYLDKTRPESSSLFDDLSVSYSFNMENETILLVDYKGTDNDSRQLGNIHKVEFEKSFPRYKLLSDTLVKIDSMNQTLKNLTKRIDAVNMTYQQHKDNMVTLDGNETISGEFN